MGEMRNVYEILIGKPEGKRPLGRTKSGWEYNIEKVEKMWTGCIWFRVGTSGGLL
jgi:hypothetical protein